MGLVSKRVVWIVVDDPADVKPPAWRELTLAARSLAAIGWHSRLVILAGSAEPGLPGHVIRLAGEGLAASPDSRAAAGAIDALAVARGRPLLILAPEDSLAAESIARLSVRWQVRLVARIEALRVRAETIELVRRGTAGRHSWQLGLPIEQPLAGTLAPTFAVQGFVGAVDGFPTVREEIDVGVLGRDTDVGEPMVVAATVGQLEDARVVVAGGAGFASPDRLDWLTRLAELLGGVVGCTRPLADRGWLPFANQIGTTGHTIAPDLYLALGISGAAQHLASVRDARHIIAVNIDRAAPMMAAADLAVVADLDEFLPHLIDELADLPV